MFIVQLGLSLVLRAPELQVGLQATLLYIRHYKYKSFPEEFQNLRTLLPASNFRRHEGRRSAVLPPLLSRFEFVAC